MNWVGRRCRAARIPRNFAARQRRSDGCGFHAHHQGGLAHLPRRQDVAEFTAFEAAIKVAIGLALDARRRVMALRGAGDVELVPAR
jgi:hypothetical protein